MSWLRWWDGTCTDPKWRVVALRAGTNVASVIAVWAYLLEEARPKDGELNSPDAETIGVALGIEPDCVDKIVAAMKAKACLDDIGIANWTKRQPKREDDSRDRVAEFRKRQKAKKDEENQGVDVCNAHVTQCNAPEAEAEAEREITGLSSAPSPRDARLIETRAAIASAYQSAGHLPPDTARAGQWLAAGYEPDEIASVVAGVLQRGTVPGSLKYFDKPLSDLRTVPRAPPRREAKPNRPKSASDYLSAELRKINDAKPDREHFAGITIDATAGTG